MALPVIVFGDINDISKTGSVRAIAVHNGLNPLRYALKSDKIDGEDLRSFNGWKKTLDLPHDGAWLDEIFTRDVKLQDAALRRTDNSQFKYHCSDHNGLRVDAYVGTAVERMLQINMRRSDLVELVKTRKWVPYRQPMMDEFIDRVHPSVIGCQEITDQQLHDVLKGLPPAWNYVGYDHNVRLLFDGNKWEAIEGTFFQGILPSGLRKRYLTLVRLRYRASGWTGLFGSLHLAAGGVTEPNPAKIRLSQMNTVIDMIEDHSGALPVPTPGV